jgi:two-component system nitrogen regulation response regulator NtrX
MPNILIVDDESQILRQLSELLTDEGYTTTAAPNATEGLKRFEREYPDLVLLDLHLPDGDGLDVLRSMRETAPDATVVIISGFGTIAKAVEAIRLGAYDFIEKPLESNRVLVTVKNVLDRKSLERTVHTLKAEHAERYKIVGESSAIRAVLDLIKRVSPAAATVMITGESGTGKELVARRIHADGPRALKPFVKVNCAAVPNELIESEMFGHERGAFTGATGRRVGYLGSADGGCLFLDEVGDMGLFMQAKLLRALEDKEIVPLGSSKAKKIDVRLLAATNKNLPGEVHEGNFREDLLHRLSVLIIPVPSLRERKEDIPLLLEHFLKLSAAENNLPPKHLTAEGLNLLMLHDWPGNVRELRNVVERVTILSTSDMVDRDTIASSLSTSAPARMSFSQTLSEAHESFERDYILSVLNSNQWKMETSAKALGIDRSSLFRKIKRLGIQRPRKRMPGSTCSS